MKTKSRAPYFLIVFATVLFLGQGCVPQSASIPAPVNETSPEEMKQEPGAAVAPSGDSQAEEPTNNGTSEQTSSYQAFDEERFKAALSAGHPVYLYFYASWCPTCREQEPRNERVIPNHPGGVQGFRIHTLDSETGPLEKRYAEEYNIFTQHTAIYFRDGEEVFRRIGTQSEAQLDADLNAISQ